MKTRRIFKEEYKTEQIKYSKIPKITKEEIVIENIDRYKSLENKYDSLKVIKYRKKDVDKIIKIQRWWKNIFPKLNNHQIEEKTYMNRNKETIKIKHFSFSSLGERRSCKYDNNSFNSYSNYNVNTNNTNTYSNNTNKTNKILFKNNNSKSYTNINNLNTNPGCSTNYYFQTMTRKTETKSNNKYPGSLSTSPSAKSKYIIETKKVEIFRKPFSTETKNKIIPAGEISKIDLKHMIKDIWNEESYCSTVESLCISDENRNNSYISQNTLILEEYEDEINKLRNLLIEKDDELNNLMINLNKEKFAYIKNWNEVNIPSPINEIHVQSFKNNNSKGGLEFNEIDSSEKNQILSESITEPEYVLEIQEMNALSIISKKNNYKNICQHLQSFSIFSTINDELDEDYIIEKVEKVKTPLVLQKIEEINITSIIPKTQNLNKIQELDGLEIICLGKDFTNKNIIQNLDQLFIKSNINSKYKKNNIIQELDGIQILKINKGPFIPQSVDELLIQRDYDMLLVKPIWNSLKMQGAGLNLLSMKKDNLIENQEVDEFEIPGKKKPELLINSQEKINVIISLPENIVSQKERFTLIGKEKLDKTNINKEIEKIDKIELKGIEPHNDISKLERFMIGDLNDKKEEECKILKNQKIVKEPLLVLDIENIENIEYLNTNDTDRSKEKIDWNKIIKPIKTTKVLIKSDITKKITPKKIIEKEEIETIERIYNNKIWNEITKPIKTTKLMVKGIKIKSNWNNLNIEEKDNIYLLNSNLQKESEEFIIENFAFNLSENNKKFKEPLLMENNDFNLLGKKPLKKKLILIPAQSVKLTIKQKEKEEKIRVVEKIIEKKINWNESNIPERNNYFNLNYLKKKSIPILNKQITNKIKIIGAEIPKIPKEKTWNNLRAQKSAKFVFPAKAKTIKRRQLLVANGDKFFIQREYDDDVIYNDDYNTRKEKEKENENENEKSNNVIKKEIIKEKEIIPRYQREIRAQIGRVKEISESESSSSDIDVLEAIKAQKILGKDLINIANGYQTKILDGEVIYKAKNGISTNLSKVKIQKYQKYSTYNNENDISNNIDEEKKINTTTNFMTKMLRCGNDDKKIEQNEQNNMKKQIIITTSKAKITTTQNKNEDINDNINGQIMNKDNQLKKIPNCENKNNEIKNQKKKGEIIFNPKIKTLKAHYSTNNTSNISSRGNIIINSRKEYEKKLKVNNGNMTERGSQKENNKNIEIRMKRSKVKNVEYLRDCDSQKSF